MADTNIEVPKSDLSFSTFSPSAGTGIRYTKLQGYSVLSQAVIQYTKLQGYLVLSTGIPTGNLVLTTSAPVVVVTLYPPIITEDVLKDYILVEIDLHTGVMTETFRLSDDGNFVGIIEE